MIKLYEVTNEHGTMEMYEGGIVRFPKIVHADSKAQTHLFPLKGMHAIHGTTCEVGTFFCRYITSGSTSSGTRKMYISRKGSDDNDYWLTVASTTSTFDECEMNAGSLIDLGCFLKEE